MEEQRADAPTGPCRGIRVLDFSTVVSGPLCAQILGDLGADVVKVETPGGDFSRHTPPLREGMSGLFSQFNRNKRSIVVDLKNDQGRDVAHSLAASADVLIENFRPGVADRLGIGFEALREKNPGIVYLSINGFGPDGPYASQPAYDLVIQGLVGMMPVQSGEGVPPQLLKSLVADKCAALTSVTGVMAALLERERNGGRGQRVEVPMLDAFAAYILPDMIVEEAFQPPVPTGLPPVDIYKTWATSDGHVVGIVIQDSQFEGLCRAMKREDLLEDSDYNTFIGRLTKATQLYDLIEDELAKWTTAEFIARARECGAPFAPVNTVEEFFEDPQVRHNRTWFEAEDPAAGRARYIRYPTRYSDTPASLRRHPPRLGQHTDEILGEAGYGASDVERLRSGGVVG